MASCSAPQVNPSTSTEVDVDDTKEKRPKRKVAIIFGYVGERYCGLQWNHDPTNPTIEEELMHALHRAGFIADENMGTDMMQKLGWERASRTDKGVHALKNLISVKLMLPLGLKGPVIEVTDPPKRRNITNVEEETEAWKEAVKLVNAQLPTDIHVYSIVPVTRSFNGYQMCHERTYEYFLPTFALMSADEYRELMPLSVAPIYPTAEDLEEDDREYEAIVTASESAPGDEDAPARRPAKKRRHEGADDATGSEKMMTFRTIPDAAMRKLSSYRITAENLAHARRLFSGFVGTLRYHNFTPKGRSSDPSTIRFIKSVTVDDPIVVTPGSDELLAKNYRMPEVYDPHGLEWVRIELVGQSFMLNQIRKMIGAVSTIMICGLDDSYLAELMDKQVSRGIPMAPANGLFLSNLDFTMYNLRLNRIQVEGDNGRGKQGVHMEDCSAEEVSAVRRRIVDVIARREMREHVTGRWIRSARHVVQLAWHKEMN